MESAKTTGKEKKEQGLMRFEANSWPGDILSDFPCGTLRCTYEEYPKILYANKYMFQFLGITEENADWSGFIRNNIYFMIPFQERRVFRKCLSEAEATSEAITVEHNVHNGAGSLTRLMGWVRLWTGPGGEKEYHFLYMRVPESRVSQQQNREHAYQQVLKGTYDLIFQIDAAENTIECMHRGDGVGGRVPVLYGTKIIISSIIKGEFFSRICENDRKQLEAYFSLITENSSVGMESPVEITFSLQSEGQIREYHAVASRLDEKLTLLCVRDVTSDEQPAGAEDGIVSQRPYQIGGGCDTDAKPRVRIQTFGYFDVFVDEKPVIFRYEKSKEMLAILVDRRGSFVANPYFITCLWENEPYSEKIQSRCRQTVYRMMETLKKYGIEDIIEKVDGKRRIVPEKIDCDFYNYLHGQAAPDQLFGGAYMSDYSWGEATLSGLSKNSI